MQQSSDPETVSASAPVPDTADQDRVFAFLSDPLTHGEHPVRRIDTHAASVFLAGTRALKVKRAVKFPFLDYSTLEKRKEACEQEIEVNRNFAPQIYRGCVPITKNSDGSLQIDGQGTVVEWAVDMLRFDESRTLDKLAAQGAIDRALSEGVADAIRTVHQEAPIRRQSSWLPSIAHLIEANSAAFAGSFDSQEVKDLERNSYAFFQRTLPILQRRERDGLIRRCHGDLHLSNIAIIDGKPALFDAIEFDPAVATTDVLYDLAFILMDLLHYEQVEAANLILARYLLSSTLEDLDGLIALPLFMSIRAGIRANVLLARRHKNPKESHALRETAAAYFSLAVSLIKSAAPKLIAVGGLSGTGKTTLARKLAQFPGPPPGALVLRSDIFRKRRFGVSDAERLPAESYTSEVSRLVYEEVLDRAERILRHGYSVIIDAAFTKPEQRSEITKLAKTVNVPFVGFFLHADLATRLRRVGSRVNDASDATTQIVQRQENYEIGGVDWTLIEASGTPEETLAKARVTIESA